MSRLDAFMDWLFDRNPFAFVGLMFVPSAALVVVMLVASLTKG